MLIPKAVAVNITAKWKIPNVIFYSGFWTFVSKLLGFFDAKKTVVFVTIAMSYRMKMTRRLSDRFVTELWWISRYFYRPRRFMQSSHTISDDVHPFTCRFMNTPIHCSSIGSLVPPRSHQNGTLQCWQVLALDVTRDFLELEKATDSPHSK